MTDKPTEGAARRKPVRTRYASGNQMEPEDDDKARALLPPYFEAVGRIASAWSTVEQIIDDTIWTLAKVDHDLGACITSQFQSLYPRFKALVALVQQHGGSKELIAAIQTASYKANDLAKERNRAVHDPIGYHTNKQIAVTHRVTAEKELIMDLIPIDLQEYKKIRERISAFEVRILKLRDQIYSELPSSLEK